MAQLRLACQARQYGFLSQMPLYADPRSALCAACRLGTSALDQRKAPAAHPPELRGRNALHELVNLGFTYNSTSSLSRLTSFPDPVKKSGGPLYRAAVFSGVNLQIWFRQ